MNPWAKQRKAKELREAGIWVPIRVEGADWRFLVRSRESKQYQAALEKHLQPMRRRYKNQEPPAEETQAVLIRIFAEGAIVDWQGVTDENGQPLPYSLDNAVMLLGEFPDIRDIIAGTSTEYAAYLAEAEETRTKN